MTQPQGTARGAGIAPARPSAAAPKGPNFICPARAQPAGAFKNATLLLSEYAPMAAPTHPTIVPPLQGSLGTAALDTAALDTAGLDTAEQAASAFLSSLALDMPVPPAQQAQQAQRQLLQPTPLMPPVDLEGARRAACCMLCCSMLCMLCHAVLRTAAARPTPAQREGTE